MSSTTKMIHIYFIELLNLVLKTSRRKLKNIETTNLKFLNKMNLKSGTMSVEPCHKLAILRNSKRQMNLYTVEALHGIKKLFKRQSDENVLNESLI